MCIRARQQTPMTAALAVGHTMTCGIPRPSPQSHGYCPRKVIQGGYTHESNLGENRDVNTFSIGMAGVFALSLNWKIKTEANKYAFIFIHTDKLGFETPCNSFPLCIDVSESPLGAFPPPTNPVAESLKVNIAKVQVMFEVENLDYHVPRLCMQTSLQAHIQDWSKQVGM